MRHDLSDAKPCRSLEHVVGTEHVRRVGACVGLDQDRRHRGEVHHSVVGRLLRQLQLLHPCQPCQSRIGLAGVGEVDPQIGYCRMPQGDEIGVCNLMTVLGQVRHHVPASSATTPSEEDAHRSMKPPVRLRTEETVPQSKQHCKPGESRGAPCTRAVGVVAQEAVRVYRRERPSKASWVPMRTLVSMVETITGSLRGDGVAAAAQLLHDFNVGSDEPAPPPHELAELIQGDHVTVLLAREDDTGAGVGVAVMRIQPSVWSPAQEVYLAELYVVPSQWGRGYGRKLVTEAMRVARAGCRLRARGHERGGPACSTPLRGRRVPPDRRRRRSGHACVRARDIVLRSPRPFGSLLLSTGRFEVAPAVGLP